MTRASSPPALAELRHPTTSDAQLAALKQLKNYIVGHDQRKELVIRHGIVAELERILASSSKLSGKRRSCEINGAATSLDRASNWSTEDEIRLQATLIVGSLAHGGPAFVTPLLNGNLLQPLLQALSPGDASSKLIVATLRTLITISDACSLECPRLSRDISLNGALAALLYSKPIVESFAVILSQKMPSPNAYMQILLTSQLISKTCKEEAHQMTLVRGGVLDLLASRLAAIIFSMGYHLPNADATIIAGLPPASPKLSLPSILEGIGAIVRNSSYRVARFLYSPAIVGIFPPIRTELPSDTYTSFIGGNSAPNVQGYVNPVDCLLPQLQAVQNKSEHTLSRTFPPLAALSGDLSKIPSVTEVCIEPSSRTISTREFESPLYGWLIYLSREESGVDRLVAISLLSLLTRFTEKCPNTEHPTKNRDRVISFLVVPILVKMIIDAYPNDKSPTSHQNLMVQQQNYEILERAPGILAELIAENGYLQRAAVDANAIKILCRILRKTFDPVPASTKPLWHAQPPSPVTMDAGPGPSSSSLGKGGLSPETAHALKCREGALKALAAIAHKEDQFRKQIIENGGVACITDSLTPYPDEPTLWRDDKPITTEGKDGNPVPVLIAACNAAKTMSRSVNVLRTSLIDYGIAKPIFSLLQHHDIDVKIAATEVLCNLLLNFSPMKEDLVQAGVMKLLCQHAHSANTQMRLNSIWALKHLVLTAPHDVKVSCLEELGTGWLIQTITGEVRESSVVARGSQMPAPLGMGTPNAAGEQVDILNAIDEPLMDIDTGLVNSDDDEEGNMAESTGSLRDVHTSRLSLNPEIKSRLKSIKEAEQNPIIRAQADDFRIQEQALDLIRNLISDPGSGAADMIDHLLKTFEAGRFFDILTSKLRPKHSSNLHQRRSVSASTLPSIYNTEISNTSMQPSLQQPPEIILATVFILVHIANGKPSHKSLLISQPQLLQYVLPLFHHADRRIRVSCVWLINNLTWIEDTSDQVNARQRALELRNLGVEERCKHCMNDNELDVRERAKTALEQMGKLLEGLPSLGATGPGLAGPALHRGWER